MNRASFNVCDRLQIDAQRRHRFDVNSTIVCLFYCLSLTLFCVSASQCQPNGFLLDDTCYYASEDEAISFVDAQHQCRQRYGGINATLAVIDSQRINDFLSDLLQSRNGNYSLFSFNNKLVRKTTWARAFLFLSCLPHMTIL